MTREGVEQLLKHLPDGSTELMCHPGYADADLKRSSTRLQESRQTELDILTDPRHQKTCRHARHSPDKLSIDGGNGLKLRLRHAQQANSQDLTQGPPTPAQFAGEPQ